jgi:hypothetical protein
MSAHQFIKLAAGGNVLILKTLRFMRLYWSEGRVNYFLVYRRRLVASTREKAGEHGEAVGNCFGTGRLERERRPLSSEAIYTLRVRALTTNGPDGIHQMLFHQGNFRLHGQHNIRKIGFRTEVGSNARQNPCAPLLVHPTSRAIYRIHNYTPDRIFFRGTSWQHNLAILQPFGYEDKGNNGSDFALKEIDNDVFTDAVNGVDRISFGIPRDAAQFRYGGFFARGYHGTPNPFVKPADGFKKLPRCVRHNVTFVDCL